MTEGYWRVLLDLSRLPYLATALSQGRVAPDSAVSTLPPQLSTALHAGDLARVCDILDQEPVPTSGGAAAAPPERPGNDAGSLILVGVGVRFGGHLTAESEAAIRQADRVVYLVTDPATRSWLHELNPHCRSLSTLYDVGKPRQQIYDEMVAEIARDVALGGRVCFVIYGHPGVLVQASHRLMALARERAMPVTMFPGVSAEACLLADIGYDPGQGLQSFEATEFLLFGRHVDTSIAAVLWQIGIVGVDTHATEPDRDKVQILAARLAEIYGPDHEVLVYEAAFLPGFPAKIIPTRLDSLADRVTMNATLFIPPSTASVVDGAMAARLGYPTAAAAREPFVPYQIRHDSCGHHPAVPSFGTGGV